MNEAGRLSEWSKEHFRMTHGCLVTAIVLITGYRRHECPLSAAAIEEMTFAAARVEREQLRKLEKMGLAVRGPKVGTSGLKATWLPTARLFKLLPEPAPEEMPGVVKVRAPRPRPLMRQAG